MDRAEKDRFKSRFFMQKPAMTAWRLRQTRVGAQQSQAGAVDGHLEAFGGVREKNLGVSLIPCSSSQSGALWEI